MKMKMMVWSRGGSAVASLGLAGLASVAVPAWAEEAYDETYDGPAYLIDCADDGCALNGAGFNFFAPAGGDAHAALAGMDPLTAVEISGTLSDIGDSSATIDLTLARPIDNDPFETPLRQMQGNWQPRGEPSAFSINIVGMDWTELDNGEIGDAFLISPGSTCTDVASSGGMVVALYRYGDDPEMDACWQVEFVDATRLSLRDATGGGRFIDFDRDMLD